MLLSSELREKYLGFALYDVEGILEIYCPKCREVLTQQESHMPVKLSELLDPIVRHFSRCEG
jgi:hypothetical protein